MNLTKITTIACTVLGVSFAIPSSAADREKSKKTEEGGKISACDEAWAPLTIVSDKMEIAFAKTAEPKVLHDASAIYIC